MTAGAAAGAAALILPAPIIMTASLSPADFAWADGLRRAHFPPGRNQVPAHITLFRHLPPSLLGEAKRRCAALTADHGPPRAAVTGILAMAEGAALRVDCPGLSAMQDALADAFASVLIPQDRGQPRLHITIQNRAEPAAAKALATALAADFAPRPLAITGLALWWYRGGPWEPISEYRFRGRR